MKKFIPFLTLFLFASLIPSSSSAARYSLSYESKHFITMMALVGAGIGGLIGGVAYAEKPKQHSQSFLSKCKDFATYFVMPTTIGAALMGGCSYFFTHEKNLEWAENKLLELEHDSLFNTAVATDNVADIKEFCIDERFPTIAAHEKLTAFYNSLISLKKSIIEVMQSNIYTLKNFANGCLVRIEHYESYMRSSLRAIKDDPQYLKEVAVQSARKLAQAQQELAYAARRAADAQYIQAINQKPDKIIVIQNK